MIGLFLPGLEKPYFLLRGIVESRWRRRHGAAAIMVSAPWCLHAYRVCFHPRDRASGQAAARTVKRIAKVNDILPRSVPLQTRQVRQFVLVLMVE
jgi:hypothetical protein